MTLPSSNFEFKVSGLYVIDRFLDTGVVSVYAPVCRPTLYSSDIAPVVLSSASLDYSVSANSQYIPLMIP